MEDKERLLAFILRVKNGEILNTGSFQKMNPRNLNYKENYLKFKKIIRAIDDKDSVEAVEKLFRDETFSSWVKVMYKKHGDTFHSMIIVAKSSQN